MGLKIVRHGDGIFVVSSKGELRPLKEGEVFNVSKSRDDARSVLFNASLHLWWHWVSNAFVGAGIGIKKAVAHMDAPITPVSVKEVIWKSFQLNMTGKYKSSKLTNKEATEIQLVMDRYLKENFGLDIRFPSVGEMSKRGKSGYRVENPLALEY